MQKLELTWIGKGQEPTLEPRLLIEQPQYQTGTGDNKLIHGDNLLALKALEADMAGQIKCIYIDPPYNTGSAFEHYDDGLEHSQWLNLMAPRLKLLRQLLSDDGSMWISIDDNEAHYLKVLLDEIFGRQNFVTNVVWEKKYAPKSDSKYLSESHDHILVYAKSLDKLVIHRLSKTEKQTGRYKNIDDDPRGPWKASDVLRNEFREYAYFPVTLPNGKEVFPPSGTSWRYTKEKFAELIADNRIWFGKDGSSRPAYKRFISEVSDTIPAVTIWKYDEVGHNDEAKKEVRNFNSEDIFSTPKPERLIERILQLATNEGDWVLDSFLGSGTTAAVAHKMGRRWIGIELGTHAYTHCLPRLQKVVSGQDQGGISKAVGWQGGGGFRVYELAPSLLRQDPRGLWVIDPRYHPDQLAAAVCLHEGFRYAPQAGRYWQHGQSTEKDFLFVTTQFVTQSLLDDLLATLATDESLLLCCTHFQEGLHTGGRITLRKIPVMLLGRCEFGRDDYSLHIVAVPREDTEEEEPLSVEKKPIKPKEEQLKLF